jgi:hypothetical protein
VYFLVPSGLGAALYCVILSLFLKVYRKYRQEERQRKANARADKDDAERE